MKIDKDDIFGLVGSALFHVVIFLILWFSVLKTKILDEDGGVLVNFGNVDMAAGQFEPKYTGQELPQETTTPPPPAPTPKVETPKEDLLTQDIEESVSIDEQKKKKEEKRKKEQEEKKRKEEQEKSVCANKRRQRPNGLLRKDVKKRKISATRWQELSVLVLRMETAKVTRTPAVATKEARLVIRIMEPMKVLAVMANLT